MPLPIAHSTAGVSVYLLFRKESHGKSHKEELLLLVLCLTCSNLPDLDIVPGILIGQPAIFHPSFSHSILACFGMAIVTYLLVNNKLEDISRKIVFICCITSIFSHLVLDYFSSIPPGHRGLLLLWPFDLRNYISNFPLFHNVHQVDGSTYVFLLSLFNIKNFLAIIIEFLFSGILISMVMVLKRRSSPFSNIFWITIFLICSTLFYLLQKDILNVFK